jgi:metallo-beta-lactamase class B
MQNQLIAMKSIFFVILACAPLTEAKAQTISLPFYDSTWSKPHQPFRIAGNLYYVGTHELACFLITGDKGHILINTGLAESTELIKESIEHLGFKFSDIKILLTNQAHYDHVAALAEIQALTGANVMVQEADAPALRDGGKSDYIMGSFGKTFEPVKVDRLLKDNDTIELGDIKLLVLHHPGHTKGATSFVFETRDENRKWKVLIANAPTILSQARISGMPSYPNIGKDYDRTLRSLKEQKFDIWVAAHASQFDLHKKYNANVKYNPQSFVDATGFEVLLQSLQRDYNKRLKEN